MQVKMIILLINLAKRRTKNSKIAQTKIMHFKDICGMRSEAQLHWQEKEHVGVTQTPIIRVRECIDDHNSKEPRFFDRKI